MVEAYWLKFVLILSLPFSTVLTLSNFIAFLIMSYKYQYCEQGNVIYLAYGVPKGRLDSQFIKLWIIYSGHFYGNWIPPQRGMNMDAVLQMTFRNVFSAGIKLSYVDTTFVGRWTAKTEAMAYRIHWSVFNYTHVWSRKLVKICKDKTKYTT